MKPAIHHPCNRLAKLLALALQLSFYILHFTLYTPHAHAAVPLAWDVEPRRATPAKFDRYHGETLDLTATFRGFGELPFAPGADVRLYFQTNGMGSAWWNAPASVSSNVVTGTFSPSLDPGADSVTVFFGAPSNAYASAIIKLRPSPGFSPAAMPAPGIAGVVSLENYYTKDEVESKIAELAPTPGNYETVSNKAMNAVQPEALSGKRDYADLSVNTNAWLLILPDGSMEWMEWNEVAYGGCWCSYLYRQMLQRDTGQWVFTDLSFQLSDQVAAPADATSLTFTLDWYGYLMTYRLHRGTRLALAEEIPSPPDLTPYATKSALQSVSNIVEDTRTESALVYRLYSGSNVVCEVTNYNSQVHAPSLRLMQLNESNEYFTVWAETNGLTRTLNSAAAYTDSATNAALTSCAHTYAPRAWSRTTSGLGSDAPANTTWISTPRTVIAGGLEYAKIVDTYGEVWVLTSNGMAAEFNPDTNAYFRITADDGTPVFSIEKSDAQVVGAYAEGITVSANSVTVPVPVVSAEAPTMYWRNQLESGDWSDQTTPPTGATVTWTGSAGSWVCTVTFSGTRPPLMFFKFSFVQEGGVMIRNNATTDLSSGIWVNGTKFVPSVSGNNLIWTKQ